MRSKRAGSVGRSSRTATGLLPEYRPWVIPPVPSAGFCSRTVSVRWLQYRQWARALVWSVGYLWLPYRERHWDKNRHTVLRKTMTSKA